MLSAMTTFAQTSLDGTWSFTQSEKEKDDDFEAEITITMDATYVFSGNTFNVDVHCVFDMHFDDGGIFTINVVGSHLGTYTKDNDVLTLVPDKRKKPQVDVSTSVDNVVGGGFLKALLVGPFKKEISNEMKEVAKYRVLSISKNELVLEDILTEKEIKAGEKAEIVTFTRQ